MARFLRSTGQSRLGKPAVVGAAVVFRPISVTTAAGRTAADYLRHRPAYKLNPPTTLATPVVFVAPAIRAKLASLYKQPPRTDYKLVPPSVVAASITFSPPATSLARTPQQYYKSKSKLRPPTVLYFLAAPIRAILTRTRQQPPTTKKVNPPSVIGAAITFRPVLVSLAEQPKPKAKSKLNPPTTLATLVTFVAAPLRVALSRLYRRPVALSRLSRPSVVGAAVTFGPIRTEITRTPRSYYQSKSKLRPPTILFFVANAVKTALTRTRQQPPTTKKVAPPTIVGAAFVTTPIRAKIARTPQSYYQAKSRLRAPTVLGTVITFVFRPVQVFLTRTRQQPPTTKKLGPPTVVAPAIVFRALQAKLARTPLIYTRTRSKLNAPTVLGVVVSFLAYPIRVKLARTPQNYYRAKSRLRPPTILSFVARAIKTYLALPQSPNYRRAKSKLAIAFVPSFIARPIKTALAKLRPPRLTKTKLRAPSSVATAKTFSLRVYSTYPHAPPATRFVLRAPSLPGTPVVPGTPAHGHVRIVGAVEGLVDIIDPSGTVTAGEATGSLRVIGNAKGTIRIVED